MLNRRQAIKLIPLRGWDCHAEVIETFGAILLMLEESPDEDVRGTLSP